jgi:hypothetical protein
LMPVHKTTTTMVSMTLKTATTMATELTMIKK